MRIGELSRLTGVSTRSIRYYEEQGLIVPERQLSGYRAYDESAVRQVHQIKVLLSAGLNTSVIAEILPCIADPDNVLAPPCPELLDGLAAERAKLSESIDRLEAARRIMDTLIVDSDKPFSARL
ncbi:MerR family transcriptional regulator [Aeromicrobium sp. 9AM]|uniref:MerR family transcriptional regulator n=1 Tax=Aeromicrobium sp. 9AM TaxID=2653126 RepID=UPI0012F23FC0|nr:MerR family transcriptional regulator [Aeromicrobium sp. 9AM]VXB06922.1 MerR family transcriptional regulator [Aeromicrobium sp. 9AM]